MSRTRRSLAPEAAVLKGCLALLKLRGIPHWRQNTGAARHGSRLVRYGIPGCSDIVGLLPRGRDGAGRSRRGLFLAIEIKAPGGKLTAKQQAFLAAVHAAGGVALEIHDVSDLNWWLDCLLGEGGPR